MNNSSNPVAEPKSKYRLFFLYLFFSLIYLFLVYAPTVFVNYIYHDQATYLIGPHERKNIFTYNLSGFLMMLGRPLTALTTGLTYMFINTVSDLIFVRVITICGLAVLMSLSSVWLYKIFRQKAVSFIVSACIFTLPGMQVHIFYGDISNILALLFVFLSFIFIQKVELNNLRASSRKKAAGILRFLTALVFFIIATMFYPNDACFILLPVLVLVLFTGINFWPQTRLKLIRDIAFYVFGCAAYFIICRMFFVPLALRQNIPSMYSFSLTHDFIAKAKFFKDITFVSANLWNIYPSKQIFFLVSGTIFSGAILACIEMFRRQKPADTKKHLFFIIQIIFGVIILLLAGNTVNLIASGGALFHRTIFVYMAMLVLLVVWALHSIKYIFPLKWRESFFIAALGCLFTVSTFRAQYSTFFNVVNSYIEFNFIRNKIARHLESGKLIAGIHLIRPKIANIGFNGKPYGYGDEFNHNTTSFTQDIPWILRAALLEFGTKEPFRMYMCLDNQKCANFPMAGHIIVSTTAFGEQFIVPADTLVIDMNELTPVSKALGPNFYPAAITGKRPKAQSAMFVDSKQEAVLPATFTLSASSHMNQDPYLSVEGILDGLNIWHSQTPPKYPEWVEVAYEKPVKATKLKLKPQPNNSPGDDMPKRAPKDFILQASNDEKEWVDLLNVKDNLHKNGNDWHEWKFSNDKEYRYYRLYITATDDPHYLTIHHLILE